ncbi:MAG TPA: ATP-binding protein [Gemmatimonadaceae bacterium]|nr:ATP-binding protein [Gemmatimonadaceae bacterium]
MTQRRPPKSRSKRTASSPPSAPPPPPSHSPDPTQSALPSEDALRFLLHAGGALASSLDYRTTLSTLTHEAVPTIADWCAVDLLNEQGELQRLAVAHRDPAKIELVRQIESRWPQPREAPTGSYERLRTMRTDWVREITDEMLSAGAQNTDHLEMIRALGLRSFISVPLVIRDRAVGLFTVATAESGRLYSESDVQVVQGLSRRAAMAIDHARTYQFARGIVESISDPMVVYDDRWRVRYENDAALTVFHGQSMIGQVLWEQYPDLDQSLFGREMRRAMQTRAPATFVERRNAVWVEVRCYPLPDGGIAVVWKDITEQKRAEQALHYLARASEILGSSLDYETTLNSLARLVVPDLADLCSVSVVDGERIRMVAVAHQDPERVKSVRAVDERSPVDLRGNARTAIVIRSGKPDLVNEPTDEAIAKAIPDPGRRELMLSLGFAAILTVPLITGERVLGAMSLVSLRGESNRRFTDADMSLAQELARRAAIAVENARLYKEALEARSSAENANHAKTAFLARMSHELRTPLNAIGGYTELLAMGIRGPISEMQKNDLERIRSSQHHLLSLINDVLNYAKVEAGRLQYDLKPLPLAPMLSGVQPLFDVQMRGKALRFELGAVDPGLVVLVDAERLQQILLNLVSNAVKFTPSGGTVRIETHPSTHYVDVHVIDTGRGVPTDKLEAIFEPFVQLQLRGEMPQGTGLGLAISRDLARAMGGDLRAQCDGGGATFILRLPKAPSI